MGAPYYSAFTIVIVGELLSMIVVIVLAYFIANLDIIKYAIRVLIPCLLIFLGTLAVYYFFVIQTDVLWKKIAITAAVLSADLIVWYFICIGNWERNQLINIVKRKK